MTLSPKLIGRIIFSDFLELSLNRLKRHIEKVEKEPLFLELSAADKNIITIKNIPRTDVVERKSSKSRGENVITEIVSKDGLFLIRYREGGFVKRYIIDSKKLAALRERGSFSSSEEDKIELLLYKLRRITSRNEICYQILKRIVEHQKEYLFSGDHLDLKVLTQRELARDVNSLTPFNNSWVSRVIKGRSIITPEGKEVESKRFFHTKRDFNKKFVKKLLDKEREELRFRRIRRPYTDDELRAKLRAEYGIIIGKRSLCSYRKGLGVPSFLKRLPSCIYPPISESFSPSYPFTMPSVSANAVEVSGVYELCLTDKETDYNL